MRNFFLQLLFVPLSVLITACTDLGSGFAGSHATDNKNFYQHWVHSYEEQGGQNGAKTPNIFRPAGSRQFPPSRFRMAFDFNPNGQCQYKSLSPTDAHEMRNCIYTKIDNKVYIYDDTGKFLPQLSFTLIAPVSKDLMRIRYGVAQLQKKQSQKK